MTRRAPPTDSTAAPPPPASTRALVTRLLGECVRPHAPRIVLALLAMTVVAAATAANAWLMQPALDGVFLNRDRTLLVAIPLAVLAVAMLKGGATYAQSVLMNFIGMRIVTDMQARMFAHLMGADLAFFHATATGALIARFVNDAALMRQAVSTALTGLAKDSLTVVFLVAVMFHQDWRLALLSFLVFPVAIWPIARIGRRMRKVSTNTQTQVAAFTTLLEQTIQGQRVVKAYGMESYENGRARALLDALFALLHKAQRVRAAVHPAMETLGGVAIALVIAYGGTQVIASETTPGAFFSFITALLLAYQPMKSIANMNANLQEGLAAAERVFSLLDRQAAVRDAPNARPLALAGGAITFTGVSFAYGPEAPALSDLDLEIPAGRTVALVGPSGAGKSTILNLIPRFYDVDAGRVAIDGADVRALTLASLRGHMALVSQEVTLFDDTVGANIAYGRFDATPAEIEAAARAAAAHDFITALPQGYETVVGEQGVLLSGGQRQRIAIARAMLRDAPILLLDEATSALDSESERQIQAALARLMQGRTTLVIAHRLSTIMAADRIYVIDAGRVAESGTHAELLARGGAYARLHAMQFADADASPRRAGVIR